MVGVNFDLPQHPLDVKPSGNAYTAHTAVESAFSRLPDELLVHILEALDPISLATAGATCRHLRAFSRFDELWKTHCVLSPPTPLLWRGSWFATFTGKQVAPVLCSGVYSDTLYRPFLCAHIPLDLYSARIPKQNAIARLSDLKPSEFLSKWVDKPFILTDVVKRWPVFRDWSEDALSRLYGDLLFRAECVDWPLTTYLSYMNGSSDESPLYLFDRAFVEKMSLPMSRDSAARSANMVTRLLVDHSAAKATNPLKSSANTEFPDDLPSYWAPECFGVDYFTALGAQRPDFRWLIIGPQRSGSTFHKDPNGTSAWNAVITGSKYWIMFPSSPSDPPPPGVYASADQSEVTTPASIAEWLLGFHAEARQIPGCIEGVCRAGEVLHVPSGWWHLVVNLEPSIALTQNFVPEPHLHKVLRFLRDQKNAISGFRGVKDPHELFVTRLKKDHPRELEEALQAIQGGQKRKWDELVNGDDAESENQRGGFSFGFGLVSDDEDDEASQAS